MGNRAQFFFRIIHALPERFALVGGYARSQESRDRFTKTWNCHSFDSIERMLDETQPDVLVTSVPWTTNEEVNLAMLDYDVPLLMETPPAGSLDGLRKVWEKAQGRKAAVGVAEQYIFRPYHRMTLKLIEDGLIGPVHFADVSIAHGYHGTSVMRHYLGAPIEKPELVTGMLHKERCFFNGEVRELDQQIALFRFSGGKTGLLDFTGSEYFTGLRPLALRVRGDKGAIDDYEVAYMTDDGRAVRQQIERDEAGHDGNLEGFYLKGLSLGSTAYWENPFAPGRLSDEEVAIAHCMASMTLPDGPVYPLVEGLHDHYLGILWAEAAKANGKPIEMPDMPWLEK